MSVKLLILEDSKYDFELISREINKNFHNAECRWVDNMDAFVKELEAYTPDLIVSDYNLPGITGEEVLRFIRKNYEDMPFIVFSGSTTPEMEVVLLSNQANDVLTKNNLSRLPYAIQRVLNENAREKELIKKNEELGFLLNEKESLIQEVHHRVKNNLAVVSGFLSLEKLNQNNRQIEEVINTNILRIKSLAIVHELIYTTRNFSRVNITQVLKDLTGYLGSQSYHVGLHFNVDHLDDEMYLNVNQSIPFALLMVELFDKVLYTGPHSKDIDFSEPITLRLCFEEELVTLEIAQESIFQLFNKFEVLSDFTEIAEAIRQQLAAKVYTHQESRSLHIEFERMLNKKGSSSKTV